MSDTLRPLPGDCPKYREHGLVCVLGKHHAGDCATRTPEPVTAACRSDWHSHRVQAVVTGVFDCSDINDRPAEPGSHYCHPCGVILHEAGLFTPTDGTVLPGITSLLQHAG